MTVIIDGSLGVDTVQKAALVDKLPAGSVIQVVNASYSSVVSTTSSTPIDLGISATITPKFSSSKVLVLMSCDEMRTRGSNGAIGMWLYRNGSSIQKVCQELGYNQSYFPFAFCNQYLDSPATTSATTYKLYGASQYGGINCEWNANGNGVAFRVTLMEIAA